MNKGFVFRNETIGYTVLDYADTYSGNIALLQRDAYCPYVVARCRNSLTANTFGLGAITLMNCRMRITISIPA